MALNENQETPQTLKRSEAALILRVSERTVDRLISEGELPASRIGRSVRISRSDVLALLPKTPASSDVTSAPSGGAATSVRRAS